MLGTRLFKLFVVVEADDDEVSISSFMSNCIFIFIMWWWLTRLVSRRYDRWCLTFWGYVCNKNRFYGKMKSMSMTPLGGGVLIITSHRYSRCLFVPQSIVSPRLLCLRFPLVANCWYNTVHTHTRASQNMAVNRALYTNFYTHFHISEHGIP